MVAVADQVALVDVVAEKMVAVADVAGNSNNVEVNCDDVVDENFVAAANKGTYGRNKNIFGEGTGVPMVDQVALVEERQTKEKVEGLTSNDLGVENVLTSNDVGVENVGHGDVLDSPIHQFSLMQYTDNSPSSRVPETQFDVVSPNFGKTAVVLHAEVDMVDEAMVQLEGEYTPVKSKKAKAATVIQARKSTRLGKGNQSFA
ncbi:hypothetical protein AMTR_s00034p00211860 [Amborella trichopoda]|uniref:Uncharacterized protein n=1 Tax=Amborella trichopoda TaxID=13333 RepID=W1PWR7_AMBTC|nr:hypothetical protein AMTR_s00034p00211860 [Amborella trichopoda]